MSFQYQALTADNSPKALRPMECQNVYQVKNTIDDCGNLDLKLVDVETEGKSSEIERDLAISVQ